MARRARKKDVGGSIVYLSRRERQIMDVVYRLGAASAAEIIEGLPDTPQGATVRKLVRVLEEKGHLRHERRGNHHVYHPTVPREEASRSAITHVVATFFEGSAPRAVSALLDSMRDDLSREEADALLRLIDDAAKEGR